MDYKLKNTELFTSQDVKLMDWSAVDCLWIIVTFYISCSDSHSDGTHSLQRFRGLDTISLSTCKVCTLLRR